MTMQVPVRRWVVPQPFPSRQYPVWTAHGHMMGQAVATTDSNLAAAASMMTSTGELCTLGPDGRNGTVVAFQVAWNVTSDPTMGQPRLLEDGKYGDKTYNALFSATGGGVIPSACTSFTGGPSALPSPFVPGGGPAPAPHAAPWPWWKLLLLALLGAGGGYLAYKGWQRSQAAKHGGHLPDYSARRYGMARATHSSYAMPVYGEFEKGRPAPHHAAAGKGSNKPLIIGGAAVVGIIAFLALSKKAGAAPRILPAARCPDGSSPPGGDVSKCAPPLMGNNDPDAPPGGWVYNAPVAPAPTIQQTAAALAAVDPCVPANQQLVRNFQGAAGLAQIGGGAGWDQVMPPGTDGRYGGDTAKALATYVQNPPAPCYSNAHPTRPSWWGSVGTYTNQAA